MEKNKVPGAADVLNEVIETSSNESLAAHRLAMKNELSSAHSGDPKKKPEIEPEKLPKEDPGMPEEEPDEDDDDDDPNVEPPIGDDPDKEKNKLPIMLL